MLIHQFFLLPCVDRSTYLVSRQSINMEHAVDWSLQAHDEWKYRFSTTLQGMWFMCFGSDHFSLSSLLRNSLIFYIFGRSEHFFPLIFLFLSTPLCYTSSLERKSRQACILSMRVFHNSCWRYPSSAFISRQSIHSSSWLYCKKKEVWMSWAAGPTFSAYTSAIRRK